MMPYPRCRLRAAQRGTTLIEAMVAMSVVLVGLLGFASLQIITSRANQFNKRMTQATAVAMDFSENIKSWGYTDSRLTPSKTVTSFNDSGIKAGWELGREATPAPAPQFSDSLLTAANFQGLPTDSDRDGKTEFFRYWNVYAADLGGLGTADGKLVQIIVRWKEPGFGYRQVTTMAFKSNPQAIFEQ